MGRRPYKLDPMPLGMGGFGVVHRAVHRETGEVVALKKALPTAHALLRMKREIEVQRSLQHDHVMPVLDADPRGRWFTMPLATATFGTQYARTRPSSLGLANILLKVAAGLQHAHHRGHVHRDVTPSNILRINHGAAGDRWVVADWGLVQPPVGQESLPLTLTGQVLGTRSSDHPS